jgi:hypothetical protein
MSVSRVRKRRERKRGKSEPNYHDVPFIEIVLINKPFAKITIRTGALEGAQG